LPWRRASSRFVLQAALGDLVKPGSRWQNG
jgi:hypothetical protein